MKMFSFKNVSRVLGIALLAGVVAFSACKKDKDEESAGTKAGKEVCDCYSKSGMEMLSCVLQTSSTYASKMADESFAKDFNAVLAKCAAKEAADE